LRADICPPSLNAPNADRLLPKRAVFLNDIEEPQFKKSNTEQLFPNLVNALTDNVEPHCTYF
jgi:hypothetical protein